MTQYSLDFTYAYGSPSTHARFRSVPEYFIVEEQFDEPLSGVGEHLWLKIEKTGENTDWLAKKLANHFKVRKMDVGYAGKKDRHAITTQWFSIYLPGQSHDMDWSAFLSMAAADARLLASSSHDRKLKLGMHSANLFKIRLCDVDITSQLLDRLERIKDHGVPNYFGEQRFGRDGGNLLKAERWADDPRSIRDRNLRGLIMSSARSYLFNLVLSKRVQESTWLEPVLGEPDEQGLATGPLWGRGRTLAKDETLEIETDVLNEFASWQAALENVGLKQERRALLLKASDFSYVVEESDLCLRFSLKPGEYATSILREIAVLQQSTDGDLR